MYNTLMHLTIEYVAGFFDGEGCVYVGWTANRRPKPHVRINITQAKREILDDIRETLGVGGVYRQRKYWQYSVGGRDGVQYFAARLIPYSRLKKEELILAYGWAWDHDNGEDRIQELLKYQSLLRGVPVRTGRIART